MEVSMDTSPQGPAPAPESTQTQTQTQTQPPTQTQTELGTPRKRSLSAVDGEPKANANANADSNGPENQENSDPNAGDGNGENKSTVRVEAPPLNKTNEQVDTTGDANGALNTSEDKDPGTTPAAKKRKVSPASKETKQQEKEAREKQKADEKARKEEEKAKREEEKVKREEEKKAREEERKVKEEEKKKREAEREEEKKKRDAEREEKKRVKDEERAAKEEERKKKEEEKEKKEQEKSKKERAQMRLNAFFAKPKGETGGPGASPSKSASGDTATNDDAADVVSDYHRAFPEFFLQSHTSVAPPHRFQRDSEALAVMRERVDQALKASSSEQPVFRPSELFRLMPYERRWGRQAASVKDLLLQIQNMGGSGGDAVGTTEVKTSSRRPQELLSKVRMKSLKFGEDVRPPYQGTFTRKVPQSSAQKIARNPFRRCLPETNYDYDSEAEWEEPEEGEELDSEEEEEAEDDVDDDMDGFLDDEDEDQPADGKRRLIVGDLEPQSSGLCWQTASNTVDPVLHMYKIEPISDTVAFPIDPFSTVYWQKPKPSDAGISGTGTGPGTTSSTADRSTLCARGHNANADASQQQHPGSGLPLLAGTGKAKRGFPPEQLADFQEVVNGSDLTKMGLVEILKKRFPKVSKDVLKETLTSQATRVGSKESEKKWVCK